MPLTSPAPRQSLALIFSHAILTNKGEEGKGEQDRAHLADFPVVETTGMLRAAWGCSCSGRALLTLPQPNPRPVSRGCVLMADLLPGQKTRFFQFCILLPKAGGNASLYTKRHLGLAGNKDLFLLWPRHKAPKRRQWSETCAKDEKSKLKQHFKQQNHQAPTLVIREWNTQWCSHCEENMNVWKQGRF